MIEPYLIDIGLEILKIAGGILIPMLTIAGTLYAKKLERKIERNALRSEIDKLTTWAGEAKTFQLMSMTERRQAIKESIQLYVYDNNMKISDVEIELMIDRSLQGLRKLEHIGEAIYKLNRMEVRDGSVD